MKRYLTVFALLCIVGTAHGAHFQHFGGGFRAHYDVFAQDGALFNSSYFTKEDIDWATAAGSVQVPPYPQVAQADSRARSDIWSEIIGNSLRIQSYSIAYGFAATYLCKAISQTYGSTQDNQTLGIFYQINPDSGEQVGDDVMVYYSDIVSLTASGTTYYYVGGPGTMDHLAITRNQVPPVQEPDSQYEVLRFPNVDLSNSGDQNWFSGVHPFPAKIGDVIGIFAKTEAVVYFEHGPMTGDISYSNHTMILTVRPVLSGDLDYDGDVDFYDLAKLANNWLEGVGTGPTPDTTPPTPDPMQWASEAGEPQKVNEGGSFNVWVYMTAKVATDPGPDPSGVQYKFVCTNDSGYSSGGAADCLMNPGNCPEWRGSTFYKVKVGSETLPFYFTVTARDTSANLNETAPSTPPFLAKPLLP